MLSYYRVKTEGEAVFDGDCLELLSVGDNLGYLGVHQKEVVIMKESFGWRVRVFKKWENVNPDVRVFP